MVPSSRILIPLDGSQLAETALLYVPALTAPGGTTVRLVTVLSEDESLEPKRREQQRRLLASYLGTRAKGLSAGGLSVDTALIAGWPAAAIIANADNWKADLIVISTHGRSGFTRWRLGSVADKVIRSSAVNTLVIGPRTDPDGMPAIRALLVPLDGSPLAEQALPVAGSLASSLGAQIHLVRVVPPQVIGEDLRGVRYSPASFKKLVDACQGYLEEARERLGAAETTVLTGPPAERLLSYIREKSIDLVVMTSHGRGGLVRAALGSVTDRLLGGAAPILIVRR